MTQALRLEPGGEPARLIELGVAAAARDPKLSALILEVRLIRLRHRRANVLIYTEYTDSQLAAVRALRTAEGLEGEIQSIGGQDDDQARATAAQRFAEHDGLILVSTDSLAEGLNLHRHCFHLIHLDLPYNPNRLEQRNGRIDRYGQQHDPQIRYLYMPGTFEENLVLHLIAKYEKARSSLDVMPETLGVTAAPDDYQTPLTGGLSEDPTDLFRPGAEVIRTLDLAVSDTDPDTVPRLMHEIDRTFVTFELMAVQHGWFGVGMDQTDPPVRLRNVTNGAEDLPSFVAAVIEAETMEPALAHDEIRLPADWARGLDHLPGFDPAADVLRFTREFETWHDAAGCSSAFLGRAHPLVLRAIGHGCRLPGAVAACLGDCLGLLLTFLLEISAENRVVFRKIIAVTTSPGRPPTEASDWLNFGASDLRVAHNGIWSRLFASWAESARSEAALLVGRIASQTFETFVAQYEASRLEESVRLQHWLRVKADRLCGRFLAATDDLFGAPEPGPAWRRQHDPMARLVSFATDRDVPAPKRREANETLETFRAVQPPKAMPGPVLSRPIGMLMLVPRDAA
jgi:hypothetical protein